MDAEAVMGVFGRVESYHSLGCRAPRSDADTLTEPEAPPDTLIRISSIRRTYCSDPGRRAM